MSKAAQSICLFSIYLMVLGAALTASPNLLLGLLFLPKTNEVWIHVVGMLTFILGFYYFQSSKNEITLFFRWTVYGRLAGFITFCVLGFSGFGPPVLIVFGVVDCLGALWTHHCLKSSKNS